MIFHLLKIIAMYFLIGLPNMQCSKSPIHHRPNLTQELCYKVKTEAGPEDMEIIRSHGQDRIIYSSHERRIKDQLGGIHTIILDKKSLGSGNFSSSPLIIDRYPPYFRPHGISHSQYKGKHRLYAISHPRINISTPLIDTIPSHTVEVFEEDKYNKWRHVGSLSDPLLTSPNDLFALPEEKLIISNDMGFEINLTSVIDLIFKRNTTDITYYADGRFYSLHKKIPFGNGIWYVEGNPENNIPNSLYRSSHIDKSIFVYDTEWVENHPPLLELRYKIPFPGGPDNLYWNEFGFFTTTHNNNIQFLDHANSKDNISPSQVWEIRNGKETRLIFSDSGKEISAASTAIRYKNWLFISQVFDNFILACKLD